MKSGSKKVNFARNRKVFFLSIKLDKIYSIEITKVLKEKKGKENVWIEDNLNKGRTKVEVKIICNYLCDAEWK